MYAAAHGGCTVAALSIFDAFQAAQTFQVNKENKSHAFIFYKIALQPEYWLYRLLTKTELEQELGWSTFIDSREYFVDSDVDEEPTDESEDRQSKGASGRSSAESECLESRKGHIKIDYSEEIEATDSESLDSCGQKDTCGEAPPIETKEEMEGELPSGAETAPTSAGLTTVTAVHEKPPQPPSHEPVPGQLEPSNLTDSEMERVESISSNSQSSSDVQYNTGIHDSTTKPQFTVQDSELATEAYNKVDTLSQPPSPDKGSIVDDHKKTQASLSNEPDSQTSSDGTKATSFQRCSRQEGFPLGHAQAQGRRKNSRVCILV